MDAMAPLDPVDPTEDAAHLQRRLHCDVDAERRRGVHGVDHIEEKAHLARVDSGEDKRTLYLEKDANHNHDHHDT